MTGDIRSGSKADVFLLGYLGVRVADPTPISAIMNYQIVTVEMPATQTECSYFKNSYLFRIIKVNSEMCIRKVM